MSLLLTLVMVAGVTVILLVFARLVMVEKRITRSYSEIARAELMAEAGLADAQQLLLELFTKFPDSCTFWDPAIADTSTPGTVFMYRDIPANEAHVSGNGAAKIYACPLISGVQWDGKMPGQLYSSYTNTLTANATASENSININSPKRFNEDPNGWVGKLPTASEPTPIQVPWVEVKDAEGNAIGRYAFWIEDESFKLNINVASAAPRGTTPGNSPTDKSLLALFSASEASTVVDRRAALPNSRLLSSEQLAHMDLGQYFSQNRFLITHNSGGLDLSRTGSRRLGVNETVEKSLQDLGKNSQGTPNLLSPEAAKVIKQGVGRLRAAIEANTPLFGNRAMRATDSVPLWTTNPSQRTYKNQINVANADVQSVYLDRLAVNIFDSISPSPNPTVLDNQGEVWVGERVYAQNLFTKMAVNKIEDASEINQVRAIGKKPVPMLVEYVMHAKQISFVRPGTGGGTADYELEFQHYFEFVNMSDREIRPADGDLGPNPYFVLQNQPPINVVNTLGASSSNNIPTGRDFEIKLDGSFDRGGVPTDLVFAPHSRTVITTDPNWTLFPNNGITSGAAVYVVQNLFVPGTGESFLLGISNPPYQPMQWGENGVSDKGGITNVLRYAGSSYRTSSEADEVGELRMYSRTGGSKDPLMRAVLGNDYGLLDATPSIRVSRGDGGSHPIAFNTKKERTDNKLNHFRGSFFGGDKSNDASATDRDLFREGAFDPRGKMEPLTLDLSLFAFSTFVDNGMGVTQGRKKATLGAAAADELNAGNLYFWPTDRQPSLPLTAANAPMRIPLSSWGTIGSLGDIYDPVVFSTSASTREKIRPGGLTLAVGQPDPLYDGTRSAAAVLNSLSELEDFQRSVSREWAGWRLADVFSTRSLEEPVRIEGLFNPNGILRDNGAAFRALLEGLVMNSVPQVAGDTYVTANMTNLEPSNRRGALRSNSVGHGGRAAANYLAARLSKEHNNIFSPFWERGELSQLTSFSLDQTEALIISGKKNNTLPGRGLEEVVKRIIEMITPKGDTYSVYLVGQTLDPRGDPTATQAQRVMIRLHPVWEPALEASFNSEDSASVEERFRKPDRWRVEILSRENAS